jgi:hypothetical protein
LPAALPRACVHRYARINKFAEVCFERNWYSVPSQYAFRNAVLEIYEDKLRVIVATGDRQLDAIRLYERSGFRRCDAFGEYASMTPHAVATSVFFEKRLRS